MQNRKDPVGPGNIDGKAKQAKLRKSNPSNQPLTAPQKTGARGQQ